MLISRLIIAAGTAIVTVLRAIGGALYQPDDGERVSTWSIRRREARVFYLLLAVLWIGAAAGLAWSQYAPAPPRVVEWATLPPHAGDGSVYVVVQRFGVVVIPLMAAALLLTPILVGIGRVLMAIARFINDKILEPFVESKAIAPRMAVREAELQERLERELQERLEQALQERLEQALQERLEQALQERLEQEAQDRQERLEQEVQERLERELQTRYDALQLRIQDNNDLWAAWTARRDAALAQGREFNAPRPDAPRN